MSVLILTGLDDIHADMVIPKIEAAAGKPTVFRLNTDNLAENCLYEIGNPSWSGSFYLKDSDRTFSLSEISAVWYRKPVPVKPSAEISLQAARDYIVTEYDQFLRSTMDLLADRHWVNPYWNNRHASQKLANLKLAANLGLDVPRTIVTNNSRRARAFAQTCSWRVLVKPFAMTMFHTSKEQSWDPYSAVFDEAMFEKFEASVSLAPVLMQEYVEKDVELRITVVGRQVFCTSVDSQANALSKIDMRAADFEELRHDSFSLPDTIANKLLSFNQAFGLQFSTFDIILDKKGHYVWLECNPNGQWAWLEALTGQPISSAIADLLVNPDKRMPQGLA